VADAIQVRIAFISDYDSDVAEGFYIDDVNINAITYIEEYENENIQALRLEVDPNPFRNTIQIRCMIQDAEAMMQEPTLRIYDVAGRKIKELRLTPDALSNTLSWDGVDDSGRKVAPGVYFVVFSAQNLDLSEKVVMIR
jgi:hypothetical protein